MSGSLAPTCPETMCVTLINNGDGFGLGISDKTSVNEVPVIDAIKPRSPAYKEGIFKVGDRIVAINGIETLQLSPRMFSNLKNEALAAREIDLDVEIDVYDAKILFGTFDVVLEEKLRIGFIFDEMKEKSPMVLKGILKGSAAHRSGQVFPGDEITFIEFKKNEVYDPLTGSVSKGRIVTISVLRDPKKILGLDRKDTSAPDIRVPNSSSCSTDPSSSDSNPRFQQEKVVPRSREIFGLDREETTSLFIPDTRITNPSECFTDETSYLSLPRFQQKQRVSDAAVLGLDHEDKPECVRDIRVTNPSVRSVDSSSCYSNPTFEKDIKKENRSSSKTSDSVEYDREETIVLSTMDIKVPNPSLYSSHSSSNYSNSRYEQELRKKIRSSNKNSLFSHNLLSEINQEEILSTPDIKVPHPSPCPTDLSSSNSNTRCEREFRKITRSSNMKSLLSDHALLDIHREDTRVLSNPDIKAPNPSLCSTNLSSNYSNSSYEQELRKKIRSSSKNYLFSDHALLDINQEEILSTPDIRVPNPSPCPTDLSSSNSNTRCERELIKIMRSSDKNSIISSHAISVNHCEDTQVLSTPDIKAPNPSLCSTDSSSCYSNLRFQQEKSRNNYEELLKKKLRPSRKSSVIVDHDLLDINQEGILSTPDIRVPNPSPCPTDLSSSNSNTRCERELIKIMRSSDKNSIISSHAVSVNHCEDTQVLSTPDIKAPNPSLCSTDSSSCYSNPRFQQEKSRNNYEELLKKKLRPSRKSSVIVDHDLLDINQEGILSTTDIRVPNPSPCPTDLSSSNSNTRCERELIKIMRSSDKNSIISSHAVSVNHCEDRQVLSTPDIKAPNPSLCSTDSSSCYSDPRFQQEKSRNNYEELLKKKLRPSRKNSVDHALSDINQEEILSTPDIRVPNPSPCPTDLSSSNSNTRCERELRMIMRSSNKNSLTSSHAVLVNHCEDTQFLSTQDIKAPNPSLCSTDSSTCYSNPRFQQDKSRNNYEELLKKKLRPSRKNSVIVDHALLDINQEEILSTPDIRVPNPSPCPTDLSSSNSNTRCEREFRKIMRSSNKNSLISSHAVLVNHCEDTQVLSTQGIKAPNPSLCSTDSSSSYSNPRFQQEKSRNNYEELLKKKLRPSRKNSVDRALSDINQEEILSTPDIRVPNPSPCPTDLSSSNSNTRCERELRMIMRSSNKNSLTSSHAVLVNHCEDTQFLSTPDIKAPNPSLCSTDSSSCYSNPRFQQGKSRNNYEELLKNKLRPSRKNSVIIDHGHEDTTASSFLDFRAPNPSPCSTDQSSCYSNPCSQRTESIPKSEEIFVKRNTIIQSVRKNSAVIDHEVTIYRNSTSIDFGIQFVQNQVTGDWYVKDIRPNGPAHKSGVIKKFDRIIEVNGVLVHRFTDISLLESFSQSEQAGHKMTLVIRKVYREELNEVQTKLKRRAK